MSESQILEDIPQLRQEASLLSGSAHGSHEEKSFVFQSAVVLKAGTNHISVLGMTVGLPVRSS